MSDIDAFYRDLANHWQERYRWAVRRFGMGVVVAFVVGLVLGVWL